MSDPPKSLALPKTASSVSPTSSSTVEAPHGAMLTTSPLTTTPAVIAPPTTLSTAVVPSSQTQRPLMQRNVPPFLNKLYNMVCDPSSDDMIRWSDDGLSFIVTRHQDLANQVLPRFFKHGNFSSFVRQLNMYGFHKVPHLQQGVLLPDSDSERLEFSNPNFQRDRPDLLLLVTRKKGRDPDEKEPGNVDLQHILDEIAAIKKHQMSISSELKNIQRDNQVLWQETMAARERHQRHQDTIDKILRFLASVFSSDNKRAGIPRKRRFLIGDVDTDYNEGGPLELEDEDEAPEGRPTKAARFDLDEYILPEESKDKKGNSRRASKDKNGSALSEVPKSSKKPVDANPQQGDQMVTRSEEPDIPQLPVFDFSNATPQQLQGLQNLINLSQNNPAMLNQFNGDLSTIDPSSSLVDNGTVMPGLDWSAISSNQPTDTANSLSGPTSLPQVTNRIEAVTKTADDISQDIDQLGVDIQALAQQLGLNPSADGSSDGFDFVDMDAFLNTYGQSSSLDPASPPPSSTAPAKSTNPHTSWDDAKTSSTATTSTPTGTDKQ